MSPERFLQRLEEFKSALTRFDEALAALPSDLVRDAVIQRFEFTFELAWKTMKHWLDLQGMEARTPKQVLEQSLKAGLIIDGNAWSHLQECRNETSHTYQLQVAIKVDAFLRAQGQGLFHQLRAALEKDQQP